VLVVGTPSKYTIAERRIEIDTILSLQINIKHTILPKILSKLTVLWVAKRKMISFFVRDIKANRLKRY
jgi:hypothetical protein